jgi:hypothetical protein
VIGFIDFFINMAYTVFVFPDFTLHVHIASLFSPLQQLPERNI